MQTLMLSVNVCEGCNDDWIRDIQRSNVIWRQLDVELGYKARSLTRDQASGFAKNGQLQYGPAADNAMAQAVVPGRWRSVFVFPNSTVPMQGGETFAYTAEQGYDQVIWYSQDFNADLLKKSRNQRGSLEHEIGHAFDMQHTSRWGFVMTTGTKEGSGRRFSTDDRDRLGKSSLLGAMGNV